MDHRLGNILSGSIVNAHRPASRTRELANLGAYTSAATSYDKNSHIGSPIILSILDYVALLSSRLRPVLAINRVSDLFF